ncbi:SemiSWEET transporter [Flavobacteriaceae bacterium]|jgi:MtN3 and saliva related transmembrane protein|nr:SemiSWEET transporter [Flavobacteriaceae bacterium]MDB0069020.1 SemiSWEET transporter [Flavobacteriaceae bacterium]MDB4093810.1 SemiSWEET transporter [Flavobacteriaceae bacterium]MDB9793299.1 SemiSWEET transporter [Flavobacteriaceae bacterium]MDB9849042.1 SemiSWEET transporter [Flavobacteriaceae bacterium]|tara:strand:- start:1413 stop:1685 length:273 start_codon:yes stop_codon:yes gene_type:complete
MLDWLFSGGEIIGFAAAFLTTIAFVPQVLKVFKTKSVDGLSLTTYLLYVSGLALWFIHGINLESLSMIVGNFISVILTLIILFFIINSKK